MFFLVGRKQYVEEEHAGAFEDLEIFSEDLCVHGVFIVFDQ